MSDQHAERRRCRFCGASRPESPTTGGPDGEFCSTGCRDLASALGEPEARDRFHRDAGRSDVDDDGRPSADAGRSNADNRERRTDRDGGRTGRDGGAIPREEPGPSDGTVRTFLRVDGMHSPHCESFLESVAAGREGVEAVEASYVTEAVRVDRDPDRVSAADLRDALSTAGYTAYLRTEAGADDEPGRTRRAREMTGTRKRRSDDMLEIRYVAGVVFGSFLLVPYAAILYPAYLASFTDWGPLGYYEGAFASLHWLLFPLFFGLTALTLYLAGTPLLRGAYVGLRLRRPNTHLLATLTVASAYCYGSIAFLLGRNDVYFDLAIVVAAVVAAATFHEAAVKRDALAALTDLTISQVDEARPVGGGTVPVADLEPGERILVKRGERIPVDGVLAEGGCTVDEAVVTGESLPVRKEAGDAVVGGAVVTGDAAVVEVSAVSGDRAVDGTDVYDGGSATASAVEHLTRTVWSLQSVDHGVQRRVDGLAALLLPVVLAVAIAVGVGRVALGAGTTTVVLAILLSIVVTSPWALAFATPLSVAETVRQALDRGIVVFDETVFERLRDVDVVVFDKTGTLTTGEMTVVEADAPEEALRAAAALERRASHPVATAIEETFEGGAAIDAAFEGEDDRIDGAFDDEETRADGGTTDEPSVDEFRSHPLGVEGVVDGEPILVGHPDLFAERGWDIPAELAARAGAAREEGRLPVLVGRSGTPEGLIVLGDEPRQGWAETLARLGDGRDVVLLTGDDEEAAAAFRDHPAVAEVFATVPPAGKTAAVRRLATDRRVAMVGDGTNDAPALAAADLGIALGGGTALAADAADLALLSDDVAAVEEAFALASAARRRHVRTLGLALSYNAIAIPAAALGVLSPLVTAVALAVACLLVAANCWRPLVRDYRTN